MKKRFLIVVLVLCIAVTMFPGQPALTIAPVDIVLGEATISAGKYYFSNAAVSGDTIRTILISFSDSVSGGDKIFLPDDTPLGFTISSTSLSNDYVKRINLDAGVTSGDIQAYLRDVGFTIAGASQSLDVTITTENVQYDTFYNIDREHYYQYIPDTLSKWTQAYDAARSKNYMGRTGYLATIMNMQEDTFVNSLSGGSEGWLGGTILANTGPASDPLYYNGFNVNTVVRAGVGWYWACGPERGTAFYNVNSLRNEDYVIDVSYAESVDTANSSCYFNWRRGVDACEPNNVTAARPPRNKIYYETCLTTLELSGSTGKQGTLFSWNDMHNTGVGTGDYDAKGYFVEYGNLPIGDDGSGSAAFASDNSMLTAFYTAIVNTRINGAAADITGAVQLRRSGAVITASDAGIGTYTASVMDGTYDVYIESEDTGVDITISGMDNSVTIDHYLVDFSVSDVGLASGSTICVTADGTAIASGTAVRAGKTVVMTVTGHGAAAYTFAWTGDGTDGETMSSLTIASLTRAVNVICIVTGVSDEEDDPPLVVTTPAADIGVSGAMLSGSVASSGEDVTERGFAYGKIINPTVDFGKAAVGCGAGSFSAKLAGLEAGTIYHVRAYAVTSSGTFYGDDVSFSTLAAISGLPDTQTIYSDGRVTLTPQPTGGHWAWDDKYVEMTVNSDGSVTFEGVAAGTTTVTYTINGVSFSVKIIINKSVLPSTGQSFAAVYAIAAAAVMLMGVLWRLRRRKEVRR